VLEWGQMKGKFVSWECFQMKSHLSFGVWTHAAVF